MNSDDNKQESSATASGTKLERWALIAEIAGGIAIVLSVVYLALQISDNNRLLRSQAHYNALSLGRRPFELMLENENLSKVIFSCNHDAVSVDPADWERCSNYYFMQFNSWEYFYYQYADGSIPPQLWRGADAYFKQEVLTNSGFARYWSEGQIAFDEPFRSYVMAEFAVSE